MRFMAVLDRKSRLGAMHSMKMKRKEPAVRYNFTIHKVVLSSIIFLYDWYFIKYTRIHDCTTRVYTSRSIWKGRKKKNVSDWLKEEGVYFHSRLWYNRVQRLNNKLKQIAINYCRFCRALVPLYNVSVIIVSNTTSFFSPFAFAFFFFISLHAQSKRVSRLRL